MKQMTLIEMDGFLKGKCIPRDLKVNETNAEYLVRKFAEAEAKILALSEDQQKAIESIKQADAAVKLAHEKFSVLAAENASLKQSEKEFNNFCRQEFYGWEDCFTETPATDAFLAEVRAQGVEMFAQKCNSKSEQSFASDIRDNWKLLGEHATDFAAELRKGGNQ
ncbi:TPA: hypothetical protein NV740_001068 [Escherichia coli]|nr:hypothetical protein [Escherichia coli]HCJ8184080.1 hypothetical protein [Escherichia coli]HCJ8372179.1 hypothetical protein [Escherichia coli]HCJ8495786.1 hypothetical protein [Escherichia coli]HCJ8680837.1 hypothetical protein [Escherichia coli]